MNTDLIPISFPAVVDVYDLAFASIMITCILKLCKFSWEAKRVELIEQKTESKTYEWD